MSTDSEVVVAQTLKRLYPHNPDVVLGREARTIVSAIEEAGVLMVPRSFVESVLYSGSFEGEDLDKLYAEANALLERASSDAKDVDRSRALRP